MKKIIITITVLLSQFTSYATTKIYLIHGYGGIGIEMKEIQKSIDKKGFNSEIFSYPSLTEDVDSVGISLFKKIQSENYDTVSFVTYLMGGWFLSTSIGNKMSGVLASLWDGYEHKANFFLVNCGLALITAVIILSMMKWLNGIMKEHKV